MSKRVTDYARALRVLGQVLEPFHPEAYDIVCYGECYLVRCRTKEKPKRQGRNGIRTLLRIWKDEEAELPPSPPGSKPAMNVELLYTLADIEKFDSAAKQRRRDPRGMPEPYSLSNLLRIAGAYLARKRSRLLLVSNYDHSIVLLYESSPRARHVEEYPLSALYDEWVKTYLKRQ